MKKEQIEIELINRITELKAYSKSDDEKAKQKAVDKFIEMKELLDDYAKEYDTLYELYIE